MPFGIDEGTPVWAVVLRALVYALALTAVVLWAPTDSYVFIYEGF